MKVLLPTGQKRLLLGDDRAVFDGLFHGETRSGYWVLGTGFEGYRTNYVVG